MLSPKLHLPLKTCNQPAIRAQSIRSRQKHRDSLAPRSLTRTAMSRILFRGLLLVGVLALGQDGSPRPASSPALCLANYHEFKPAAIKVALPDVQQPDEYSCGAASLMSMLAYYGAGPEDYDVLKKKLGVTQKNGTDYHRMVCFAGELGLQANAKPKMTLAQLEQFLDEGKPVICSIQA